jgi:hypothetical protein
MNAMVHSNPASLSQNSPAMLLLLGSPTLADHFIDHS